MEKLEFLASMYLEAVCDETRREFLKGWNVELGHEEDRIRSFENEIGKAPYSDLLDILRVLMDAKKVIMFHAKSQGDLVDSVEYRDIMVLARSKEESDRIDILRSELLEFYRSHDSQAGRPASMILLDVKDTVRIVRVSAVQKDLVVQNYLRTPCTISYVRLDYTDYLNQKKTGNIFFAFFYPEMQRNQLLTILKHLQGFLSFRHNFKQRIERDFNGNLFGKRIEEAWRIDWLSIEKAGAHTDSSGVNKLISDRLKGEKLAVLEGKTDVLKSLFGEEASQASDSSKFLKLIYNIIIAMYFRAVISDENDQFKSADNIDENDEGTSYYRVRDLIEFSKVDYQTIKLKFGKGQSAEDINEVYLYGAVSIPKREDGKCTGGFPVPKKITFRRKYLRAFLVDILCNIQHYGVKNEWAEIYIENRKDAPGYLVFKNQVEIQEKQGEAGKLDKVCRTENYKLKQSVEFDHVETAIPKGISLGCIAHCVQWAGGLVVSYVSEGNKSYFIIKLPIIRPKDEKEDISDGETAHY